MQSHRVLLTGVSGFIGSHTAVQLLNSGYQVKGTLRNVGRSAHVKEVIGKQSAKTDKLTFAQIDLSDSLDQWKAVMTDIDFVVHIASPFPTTLPKHEDDVILPAKNGTLNVLKAAHTKGVPRVVITSSAGAAVYGKRQNSTFSEEDWTDVSNRNDTTPYFRSKTIAEKAAWDYVRSASNPPELVTILPGAVLGPVIDHDDYGTSANLVKKLIDGSMPAMPKIGFEMVDVRSVAEAHVRALEYPVAAGNRYLCANGYLEFKEIAQILRQQFPDKKVPIKTLPDFMVRLFSYLDPETKPILNDLGAKRLIDNSKIKKELDWNPIPLDQSVRETAQSLINLKFVS